MKWNGEVAELTEQITAKRARWTKEREADSHISEIKGKIEALRFEAEEQTRKGQLERAAQIQYGELPKLDAELKRLEAAQEASTGAARMLKNEVTRKTSPASSASGRGFLFRGCWKAK